MLQIYPPYKNLILRFVGSTREKGTRVTQVFNDLVDPTTIFFLEEIDPHHHEASFSFLQYCCSTTLKERGNNSRKMDLLKDQVSHGQLMEEL
jgi:hypothetical protein